MEGQPCRLGWGLCWLPVMVIRCVLEPAGKIRSFPGSRCKRRTPCGLPADLRSPAGEGEGTIRMWGIQRRLAGSARQHGQANPFVSCPSCQGFTAPEAVQEFFCRCLLLHHPSASFCPAQSSVFLPICGLSLRPAAILLFVSHFSDREAMWH